MQGLVERALHQMQPALSSYTLDTLILLKRGNEKSKRTIIKQFLCDCFFASLWVVTMFLSLASEAESMPLVGGSHRVSMSTRSILPLGTEEHPRILASSITIPTNWYRSQS